MAIGENAMPVIGAGIAVQAHADAYRLPRQRAKRLLVQEQAVGLQADLDPGRDFRPHTARHFGQERGAGQQWLAAVQDDGGCLEPVRPHMLSNAFYRQLY